MPTARRSPRCRRTGAASIPASHRRGISLVAFPFEGKEMAPRGAISMLRCALVPVVMTTLDQHDPVVMVPAAMPAVVTMLAHFSAGAVGAVMTALDHHRLGTRHRRCNDRKRSESCNHVTKFLYDVLLQRNANENGACVRTFRRNCGRILNGCSDEPDPEKCEAVFRQDHAQKLRLIAALLRRRRRASLDVSAVLDRVLAVLTAIVDRAQAAVFLQ